MSDKTQEAWRAIQDGVNQMEDALREKVRDDYVGTDEYWRDLSVAANKAVTSLAIYLSAAEYDDEGYGSNPVVCAMMQSEDGELEAHPASITLEELLREQHEDEDLPMWLDEMERLLKLFGRG